MEFGRSDCAVRLHAHMKIVGGIMILIGVLTILGRIEIRSPQTPFLLIGGAVFIILGSYFALRGRR